MTGSKICVLQAKLFLTWGKTILFFPSSKNLFLQEMFPSLLNWDTELFVNPWFNGLKARFTTCLEGWRAWKYVVDLLSKFATFFSEYALNFIVNCYIFWYSAHWVYEIKQLQIA